MPGPLQVIAMSFGPGSDFRGRVLAEVDRLQGRGILRLLDLLFVSKRDDGTIERTVIGDDDPPPRPSPRAADAVRALMRAGIVEEEATHEAIHPQREPSRLLRRGRRSSHRGRRSDRRGRR
jgi:hypothetical protein